MNKPETTSPTYFHHIRDGTSAGAAGVDLAEKLAGLVHSMIAKLAKTPFYGVPSNHDSHPKER